MIIFCEDEIFSDHETEQEIEPASPHQSSYPPRHWRTQRRGKQTNHKNMFSLTGKSCKTVR
jgi:hypothetical protein